MPSRAEVTLKLNQTVPALLAQRANVIVHKVGEDAIAHMIEGMERQGGGRLYRRHGHVHQASAPGEPPARDEGTLAGSIQMEDAGPAAVDITVGAAHGIFMEKGTSHIAPRPFVQPAIDAVRPAFEAAARQLLR